MHKKETNHQSNNREEIKKNKRWENHPLDMNRIREIARFIADSSYEGRYVLERHTKSLYRFCFGINKSSSDVPMFEGKTANEAMYRAIAFELMTELKPTSREKLTTLAECQLATIQDDPQKHKGLEEKLTTTNGGYKELMMEGDELETEMEAISVIVGRITNKWKDDEVMQSFEKNIASASWKKRPSVFIAFLMDNIEKLMHEATSYAPLPIDDPEEIEKRARLLRGNALAIICKIKILEPIWSDMQNLIMDGEWHAYPEANEIIRNHGCRKHTYESIQQKRGAYFRFAKIEEYHTARSGKDYMFKRKTIDGINKFRFTIVGEEAKPEKMVEKKEDLLEVEKHPMTKMILATVKKDVGIRESLWIDMQNLIMDGKWHNYSEANEIIRKHGYRQTSMGRIVQIRKSYFNFAKNDEYHTARGGKDYLFEQKRLEGVNKFRFTPAGEEVKTEETVENGLKLGRTIDRISNHNIYENTWGEFVRLFCDGEWHTFSEPVEMFKKYVAYNKYKQATFPTLRSAYMMYAQKFYQQIKKHEGRAIKFKFEKKRIEAETIKVQNNVKCARCGQAIHHGEKSHQVDNLFYHPDCYEVMAS